VSPIVGGKEMFWWGAQWINRECLGEGKEQEITPTETTPHSSVGQ
jgi:hypothetical protein